MVWRVLVGVDGWFGGCWWGLMGGSEGVGGG